MCSLFREFSTSSVPVFDSNSVCSYLQMNHFSVLYSVTWPLNGSEAAGDLVLIKISLCCVSLVVIVLFSSDKLMDYQYE